MIEPLKIAASHEDLFADRYQRLLMWSLQLTGYDRDLAEDLLHDAFVQFTFARPDVGAIRNLDGYFYNMLRNLHVSQLRREARNRLRQFSIVEYDSADDGLRTTDLRDQQQVEADLRCVCNYACARKETASAASVLILRFFHGYYPSEIARVLRTTRQAVDVKLLIARREARISFESPQTLTFFGHPQLTEEFTEANRLSDDLLEELRLVIFRSNRGQCLSRKQLRELYSVANHTPMECTVLAHLVSCPTCLDEVNRLLGLPSLSERIPTNMLGRDKRTGGPRGGGPKGPPAPGINSWRRRARRVFEHKPQELCVAVNGYVQASQRLNSELSELNLNIDLLEDVSFVEVFSDQKLRLLLLSVDELPPAGPGELDRMIEMSDGRSLSLKLEFRSPRPTVSVAYHDPTYKEVQELLERSTTDDASLPFVPPSPNKERQLLAGDYLTLLKRVQHFLFGRGLWLRPGMITAVFALILLAALLLLRLPVNGPAPTAADLLQKAAVTEEQIAARTDTVLHRLITVEEYRVGPDAGSSGDLISRHKVESWHSAEKGITARRFFDDKNNLIAGEWDRADGRTFYNHGSKPVVTTKREPNVALLSFGQAWQMELSAKQFNALIGDNTTAKIVERPDVYIVSYEAANGTGRHPNSGPVAPAGPESGNPNAVLVKATLSLSRADLHAAEQTLLIRIGDELREYRFMETSFERRPPLTVAPSVFEPEPELTSLGFVSRNPKVETSAASSLPGVPSPVMATPELEVEVLRLINQAGADLGDQVNVRRTPEGQLLVQGMVDTDQRKEEVLRALASVGGNPAVKLRVQTVAEALREQAKLRGSSAGTTTVESLQSGGDKVAADSELRRYFAARGSTGAELDQSVNRFAARMVDRSLQAMRHASALDRLAQRFSPEQLRTLDPEARTKWLGLLRAHAQAVARELSGLRRELGPFNSFGAQDESQEGMRIESDRDLQQAVHRLLELCSASDQAVRSAFTISENRSKGSAINSPRFFRSFEQAELLATHIQRSAADTRR